MASNSILTDTDDGTFYTGPLEPARQAMLNEYGDSITARTLPDGGVEVVEHRGSTPDSPNQWGVGATAEEAWRYLIGADFGPLDATYEAENYEAHQRRMLGLD